MVARGLITKTHPWRRKVGLAVFLPGGQTFGGSAERPGASAPRRGGCVCECGPAGGGRGDDRQGCDESLVPARLCNAFVGRRNGPTDDPDATWPRGSVFAELRRDKHYDDGNLHPCGERGGSHGRAESAGSAGGILLNQKSTIGVHQSSMKLSGVESWLAQRLEWIDE